MQLGSSDNSLPTRQRHVIIKNVSFSLKGTVGDNESIPCQTAFQRTLDKPKKPIHLLR